jgi:hypothetical protein
MEYIERIGFTPKILKIFFCSNHVFDRLKVIKREKKQSKIFVCHAPPPLKEFCAPPTA